MNDDHREDLDPAQGAAPPDDPPRVEPVAKVLDAALSANAEIQNLIMSFAITSAIVAVLPAMAWVYELKLLIVLTLNALMVRAIRRRWAFARGQGPLTISMAALGLVGALATICALKIALANPGLSEQIRLDSFAGPRVGDPTFAERFSALLPDTYRVVNLADSVPLIPTSTMGRQFLHVGQEVSFVGKFGDLLLNHVVDAYQYALDCGIEEAEEPSELPVLTDLDWA